MDLSFTVDEENFRTDVRAFLAAEPFGLSMLGPVLIKYGSDEQKQY